jgi:hypothetical protein
MVQFIVLNNYPGAIVSENTFLKYLYKINVSMIHVQILPKFDFLRLANLLMLVYSLLQ